MTPVPGVCRPLCLWTPIVWKMCQSLCLHVFWSIFGLFFTICSPWSSPLFPSLPWSSPCSQCLIILRYSLVFLGLPQSSPVILGFPWSARSFCRCVQALQSLFPHFLFKTCSWRVFGPCIFIARARAPILNEGKVPLQMSVSTPGLDLVATYMLRLAFKTPVAVSILYACFPQS